MDADPVAEAIKYLRTSRADLLGQLQRVDAALAALTGPIEATDLRARHEAAHAATEWSTGRKTVKAAVGEILKKKPGPWKVATILEAAEANGEPIVSPDPSSAVRTSLLALDRAGLVRRVGHGDYVHTMWILSAENAESPVRAGLSDSDDAQEEVIDHAQDQVVDSGRLPVDPDRDRTSVGS